jgi:acetylornithine deacetylase/succinyl-diaminopimelate desuccinylase-like protein
MMLGLVVSASAQDRYKIISLPAPSGYNSSALGFKRYLYGPGTYVTPLYPRREADFGYRILTAHGPNENVEKKDLLEAVEGYKKLILRALK